MIEFCVFRLQRFDGTFEPQNAPNEVSNLRHDTTSRTTLSAFVGGSGGAPVFPQPYSGSPVDQPLQLSNILALHALNSSFSLLNISQIRPSLIDGLIGDIRRSLQASIGLLDLVSEPTDQRKIIQPIS